MRVLAFCLVLVVGASLQAQQPAAPLPSDEDLSIQALLQAVETAISTTNRAAWLELVSSSADRNAATEFFDSMVPQGVTRVVVRERDRTDLLGTLPGDGYRLLVEVFIETGARGGIQTWKLDVRKPRDATDRQPWRLVSEERLSFIEGLHRLSLHPDKQYAAHDLVLKSVDLELRLPTGDVFVAETAEGVTALVLVGDGTMVFTPAPPEERGQLRIFAGSESLETSFSVAFIRLNPYEFDKQLEQQSLTLAPVVDPRTFRRAQLVFDDEVTKSFSLDLSDLSRDTWSLLPQSGDFLAEVRTRRYDALTYARATSEPEDVTLFSRGRKKNISSYASPVKLASRGKFYNEDDLVEFDVVHYDIDAAFSPEREWLDGHARIRVRVKAYALGVVTLKLNENLTVKNVTSDELGRLLFLRVRNQNSIVINLPASVARDLEITLDVTYSGPMHSQGIDQESIAVGQDPGSRLQEDLPYLPPEPSWLFSNRSFWYPQGAFTDYATARVRVTLPAPYSAVATGVPENAVVSPGANGAPRTTYTFTADQPARYIGLVVSKMAPVDSAHVALDIVPPAAKTTAPDPLPKYLGNGVIAKAAAKAIPAVGARNTVVLNVLSNRRQLQRARDMMDLAAEIMRFYAATIGDVPYDSMTVAMVESSLPGGHSPPYMVMLNNPAPMAPYTWRNDPAAFSNFPEFFIAHELAHQWWGQAVGWENYHEQWLSEGIAQYFAALYARERRGEAAFRDVLRQLRRWGIEQSDQGPIYLGYRLGHLKNDSRTFRAVVYNKSAIVLHMLRRLVGDDAFFRGLRSFYADNRFKKAGTMELRRAMESASGLQLERFFDRWIFEQNIPRVRYSTTIEGQDLLVRFDELSDLVYDIPVTVAVHYADKTNEELVVISESSVEKRIPLSGPVKSVDVNADNGALAVFEKR